MSTGRLEAFSDAVIAVVITIMVKPVPLEPLRSRVGVRKAVVDDHAAQAHDFSVVRGEPRRA
jgi:uncharacterized membrane protein